MSRKFSIILIVVLGAISVWAAWKWRIDHDEIEHLHAAWLVSQGMLPFANFFEHHHPTLWYLLAPLTYLTQNPHLLVFTVRLLDLILLALIISFTFRHFAKILSPDADWLMAATILVSSFAFLQKSMEVRPDPLMQALSFAGLYTWSIFLMHSRKRWAIISGILFGLSFIVLQKAAVLLVSVIVSALFLVLIYRHNRERMLGIIKGTTLLIISAAVPVTFFFITIWKANIWNEFFFWNYTFNNQLQHVQGGVGVWGVARGLGWSCLKAPFLSIASIAGIFIVFRGLLKSWGRWEKRLDIHVMLIAVILGTVSFLFNVRLLYTQYLLGLFIILALFASITLGYISRRWPSFAASILFAAVAVICVAAFSFSNNDDQLGIQRFVLKNTSPDDVIAVPPPYHPIFRQDSLFFWFNNELALKAYNNYCNKYKERCPLVRDDAALWRIKPPRIVCVDKDDFSVRLVSWDLFADEYTATGQSCLWKYKKDQPGPSF